MIIPCSSKMMVLFGPWEIMETEDWDPKTHQAESAKRSGEAYARFEESISDETEL